MSKLLIDDYPIQVLPKLALKIGLNEAIFLQQVHYWLNKSGHKNLGKKWLYNTYNDWQEQFPFWSVMTIRRTIANLEKRGLLITDNFNKAGFDKTKWYTIDYEALSRVNKGCVQNEQTSCSERTDGSVQDEQTNTIDYTETTSETTKDIMSSKPDIIPYKEIVDYLNEKTNSKYRPSTPKTRSLIAARFKEGFSLDDFKKVIDIKNNEWKDNSVMSVYLRPDPLFGPKFEGYLNQKGKGNTGWDEEAYANSFKIEQPPATETSFDISIDDLPF